jgi:CheY-like chemotaxis protein
MVLAVPLIRRTIAMAKRILIAEDDDTSREALIRLAKIQGYDVIAVSNGVDLLTAVNGIQIDAVITDIVMPYISGISAADIIRSKGGMTPIIAVTGLPHNEIANIKEKFARVYSKPINSSELFGYIKTLVTLN